MGENAVFLHLKSDNNLNEILYNEKNFIKESIMIGLFTQQDLR